MDVSTIVFALVAGTLSTLSPCVLPLLPAILAGAGSQHRYGPVALAGGLALSFAAISLFVATIGYGLGLSGDVFRIVGGSLMIGIGVVLLVPAAQTQWAIVSGPIQTWTEARFGGLSTSGLRGQLSLGLLLGAVWAPCVGPTLGAASLMAARGENLGVVTAVTIVFALGAAAPLLLLGLLSRKAWMAWSGRFAKLGGAGKLAVGVILVIVGLLAVTGLDREVQTYLVSISPAWLTALTTSI
ncbi:MAG: cytochrome c biogenesis CcdA family protein [Bauldia sp.]